MIIDWKPYVRAHLSGLRLDGAREQDLVEELAQHLAEAYEDARRAGLSDGAARDAALAQLAGTPDLAERVARHLPRVVGAPAPPPVSRAGRWVSDAVSDLRYAVRLLRAAPAFSLAALLSLALGVGGNAAVFSVVRAVVLRPLPYPAAERLVVVGEGADEGSTPGNVGFATVEDWRERSRAFESMSAFRSWNPTLTERGEAERLPGLRVQRDFFRVLGVGPALGRTFTADEDQPDRWQVVVLSDGLWRRRFGADPAIVGRTITLSDSPFTVIGVMPASFEPLISARFYEPAQLWAPLGYAATAPGGCRTCRHLKAVARLGSSVLLDQARADLAAVHASVMRAYPTQYAGGSAGVERLSTCLTSEGRSVLFVLWAAVGLVLTIACANLANLLVARVGQRTRELAIRASLGAERGRVIRQLLTESVLLGLLGGVAGLALAALCLRLLVSMAPAELPRLDQVAIDRPVLAFTAFLSLTTGVIVGLLPALRLSGVDVRGPLRRESRGSVGHASWTARRALVVADLALAVVLAAGAGLMARTLDRLLDVDPGFEPDRVLTLAFSLGGPAARDAQAGAATLERVLDEVRALPGIRAVAASSQVPLGGSMDRRGLHVEGRVLSNPEAAPMGERYSVSPDYLRVMSIPLRRGRFVERSDTRESMPAIVLNETASAALFPGEDPLGKRMRVGPHDSGPWRTVVGVVGDVRHYDVATAPTPQFYLPQTQFADAFLTLAVLTAGEPGAVAASVRGVIQRVDGSIPVYDVAPQRDLVARTLAARRFVMVLLGIFAGIALVMTAVGVYAVTSAVVTHRLPEYGVRMALGASRGRIFALVLRDGLPVAAAGVVTGVLAAIAVLRTLRSFLYGITPSDPVTLALGAGALFLLAMVAHAVPAIRAMRVDPVVALRNE